MNNPKTQAIKHEQSRDTGNPETQAIKHEQSRDTGNKA